MTAEIAILNRHAVALAADSAVTIGRRRAWKTANKLFSLSPANDIGIMIYGSGDFLGHSWETIAKTFRQHIGDQEFLTVSECGAALLDYLRTDRFQNEGPENVNVLTLCIEMIDDLKKNVGKHKSKIVYRKTLIRVLNEHLQIISDQFHELDDCPEREHFIEAYAESIATLATETFECKVTKELTNRLADLLYGAFGSSINSPLSTGVVVAGYGKNQFFPELIDYQVDGKHGDFVRVWVDRKQNLNEEDSTSAIVVPFAQSDMFQLFMEGITHNHLSFVRNTLRQLLDDKSTNLVERFVANENEQKEAIQSQHMDNEEILKGFFEEFSSYIQQEMIQPVVSVISTLPKEEMAAMAEALVEITTLRRKVDSPVESVGGPTDVAVISKGDGVVWIKRKQYFDLQVNQDFLQRKKLRHGG